MFTITICTDAGYKKLYKESCAPWAAYIRTPHKTTKVSGIIKQPVKGSSHAELYAIANALHIVSRDNDLRKYKLIVYSDNLYALRNHLDGTLKKAKPQHLEVYNKYIRPHIERAYAYEARHVKAHLPADKWGANPTRHYMQNWCDEEVHRVMKVAAKIIVDKHRKPLVFSNEKAHN